MTGWYTHGLNEGKKLRVRISELTTPEQFREAVIEFFDSSPPVLSSSSSSSVIPSDGVARDLSLIAS
jgi:hypothetical protein